MGAGFSLRPHSSTVTGCLRACPSCPCCKMYLYKLENGLGRIGKCTWPNWKCTWPYQEKCFDQDFCRDRIPPRQLVGPGQQWAACPRADCQGGKMSQSSPSRILSKCQGLNYVQLAKDSLEAHIILVILERLAHMWLIKSFFMTEL